MFKHVLFNCNLLYILFQMKEAELQLQTENASLLQQLYQKDQEAKELRQQNYEHHQHMHQHQFEQETRLAQLQLQLQEVQEQFRSLQNLHLQQQQQSAIDSEASSSALNRLQEQLNAALESQRDEAAAALASSKCIQNELQAARDRIKYLESAVSGHVTRLEAQAAELVGTDDHYASLTSSVDQSCMWKSLVFFYLIL
jgi:hypothetical protein